MSEVFYRPLDAATVQIREDSDGRTVHARLVPYNQPTVINARLTEEFLPGAFRAQMKDPARIRFALGHLSQGGTVIGRVTALEERSDGLYGTARISSTRDGDDALELLRDGVLDSVSIGFLEGKNRIRGNVTQRESARLTEVAIVLDPAYKEAQVLALREEQAPRERIVLPELPRLDPGVTWNL